MKKTAFVSDEDFASLVVKLRSSGVSDRAMVASIVRALPLKARTVQHRLKKLREHGPPKGTTVGVSVPKATLPLKQEDLTKAIPGPAGRMTMVLNTLHSSIEATIKSLTFCAELLKTVSSEIVAGAEVTKSERAQTPYDRACRDQLRLAIQSYSAWIHPKSDGKWLPSMGECIRDLVHRTKAYLGTSDWDTITPEQVVKAADWLDTQTNGKFSEFKRISKNLTVLNKTQPSEF